MSQTFHLPTADQPDPSFYVLFTGFPSGANVANIVTTATVEFIPASTF